MRHAIKLVSIIFLFAVGGVGAETYSNPVTALGADPFVLKEGDTYYLYCTAETWLGDTGLPVYQSKDLVNWSGPCGAGPYGLALHKDDVWGDKWFWGGDVIKKDGKFYMYASSEARLIVAVSDSPLGPFTQTVQQPMHSNTYEIDAGVFADDDGKHYLYFARYGSGGYIAAAELSDDMLSMKENTITYCFGSDAGSWERSANQPSGKIVEGPYCLKHNGTYYLIYCANPWDNIDYAIGYATASSPLGPWTKYSGNPILQRNAEVNGSGNGMLIASPDGSETYMVYHAHGSLTNAGPRKVMLDKARFELNPNGGADILVIDGPTMAPQPCPSGTPTWYGTPLITGLEAGGMGFVEYENESYFSAGTLDLSVSGVVGMAATENAMHVLSAQGLTYYGYDPIAGVFTKGGSYLFSGATAIATSPEGVVFTTQISGLNSWVYSNGAYQETGFIGFAGARDLAIDPNTGVIHVLYDGGLSAFTYTAGTLAAIDGAWQPDVLNGNAIVVDANGTIFAGRDSGINALTFNGASYVLGGWWGAANASDLVLSSDGTLFATRTSGWDLDSLVYDGANFIQTGYLGGLNGGAFEVFVDLEDHIHVGKADGLLEVIYDPSKPIVGALSIGDFFGNRGGVSAVGGGFWIIKPSTCWIDAGQLHWMSTNVLSYTIDSRTNLQSGSWETLTNGMEATPPVNSFSLPVDGESMFFRLKSSR